MFNVLYVYMYMLAYHCLSLKIFGRPSIRPLNYKPTRTSTFDSITNKVETSGVLIYTHMNATNDLVIDD
jgi:hypothetical protein